MHAALARAHCEKRRTTYVRTYIRTHVRTYVRTYASSTVSRHFGAETKKRLLRKIDYKNYKNKWYSDRHIEIMVSQIEVTYKNKSSITNLLRNPGLMMFVVATTQ